MNCFYVVAVRMENRLEAAVRFQEILTENGCKIKARLGLHEAGEGTCADDGLILLQVCGSPEEVERLVTEFGTIEGVSAKYLDLN